MQSNGGMATFDGAAKRAVTTVLSGPAGGVTAGAYACRMTGLAEPHHLRHGRHVLRRGADQGRRAVAGEPRQDRRPRSCGADDGHQHRERGRRHHRARRPARRAGGRSAERGRRAGPGLLRPRRRRADHHRLQPGARPAQRRQFPRRPDATRRGAGARGDRARRSAAWHEHRGRGRGHRPHHRREDGGGDQGDLHHARA